MRRQVFTALAGAGLFLTGLTASAQYRPRQDYGYQDEYGNSDSRIIRRVMRDLDRAENTATPASGDRWRLDRARNELSQVEYQLNSSNVPNRRDIDQAIMTVQRVVDSNQLNPRMRDFLSDDLNRLRELRNRMGY